MRALLLGILVVALLQSSGCRSQDPGLAEIRNALAIRADALNSRNITQYFSVVSLHYNDKGKSYIMLRESLEKNFDEYTQIVYEADRPSITIDGNRAVSTGGYRMKVTVREKETTLNGTEHLSLVKEPEGWKIIAGI